MAKIPANRIRTYLDHWHITGDVSGTSIDLTQELPKAASLLDDGPRVVVGNYGHQGSHMAMFDGANDAIDENIFAALGDGGADHYVTRCPLGTAENNPAYLSIVRLAGQKRSGQTGGIVLLQFDEEGAGGLIRGAILRSGAVTAGNGTGRNLGATTAGARFGVLFLLVSFTGTSITLKVQESQNDGGADAYADIAGLTSGALTVAGKVFVSTTAATEAWKRVVASGTFSAATVLVVAGTVAGA